MTGQRILFYMTLSLSLPSRGVPVGKYSVTDNMTVRSNSYGSEADNKKCCSRPESPVVSALYFEILKMYAVNVLSNRGC